jgi:hypothetical protein
MQHTFYVTTIDEKSHEHNFRFPQGETLPEDHVLKTQRPAGQFPITSVLSIEDTLKLAVLANSL